MKRLVVGLMALTVGCAPMQVERRTERGPLLRTWKQEVKLGQRTVAATLAADWPRLDVKLVSADACRSEVHEEYAEEVVTVRSDTSAAPTIAGGLAQVGLGGGLLLATPLFSDEPDRGAIDREGRYGASSRKIATGWGVALVALGLPSLITGFVRLASGGEERELRKVDTVASLRDEPCDARPAQGVVQFVGAGLESAPRHVSDGTLSVSAEALGGASVAGLLLDGEPVAISTQDAALLEAFSACVRLQGRPMEPEALAAQELEQLVALRSLAARCEDVPGSPGARWMEAVDAALRAQAEAEAMPEGPRYESFEDAVAKLRPSLRVTADSADMAKLEDARALKGQAVLLVGVLTRWLDLDSAVVEVGDARVLVRLSPRRMWAADFARGSRVELVGVVEGAGELGEASVLKVRAEWMRPAL